MTRLISQIQNRAFLPLVLLVAIGFLSACDTGPKAADQDALYIKNGYVQAPKITRFERLENGNVRLSGRASPEGRVRLSSDQNRAIGLSADGKGFFSVELLPADQGRLYELAMEDKGRLTLSEGRLFVPTSGEGHFVLLRAGSPSQPVSPDAPLLAVVDLDRAGAVAVSGRATPDSRVSLTANGQVMNPVRADKQGLYSAVLPMTHERPVPSLRIVAKTDTLSQTVDIRFDGNHPRVGPSQPVVVSRDGDAWRVGWTLPGGGAQLSFVY